MKKKIVFAVLILIAVSSIGVGVWYYLSNVRHESIEKIVSNPPSYEGKSVTIEGEVTDRTAFFVELKFFKVKDKSGEIIVATKTVLPRIKSNVRVKGTADDSFPLGDRKLLVFTATDIEEEGGSK
jgi:hypothetical protein